MSKYLILAAACLMLTALPGCDATDAGHPLEMVDVQYVVDRYSGYYASSADVTYTQRDGTVRTVEGQALPFQLPLQVQRGSTITLSATVEAPPEESGFRVAIWYGGAEVATEHAPGAAPAEGTVLRTLSVTATVD